MATTTFLIALVPHEIQRSTAPDIPGVPPPSGQGPDLENAWDHCPEDVDDRTWFAADNTTRV